MNFIVPTKINFSFNTYSPSEKHGTTYPHIVKGNANFIWELLIENRNLWIALTEVGEEDELGFHPDSNINGLGGCTAPNIQQRYTELYICFLGKPSIKDAC